MKILELIEHLQKTYLPDDECACPLWLEADVEAIAEELGVKLTRDEIRGVLDRLDKQHDAEVGISWQTIRCFVEDLAN